MTRKLRPGVHNVRIKGQGMRKVKVLASGKWRFMKGAAGKKSTKRKSGTRRSTGKRGAKTITAAQARGKARYVKVKGKYLRVR